MKKNPITISFIIVVIQLLIYLGKAFQESYAPAKSYRPSCLKLLIPHMFFCLHPPPLSDSSKRVLQLLRMLCLEFRVGENNLALLSHKVSRAQT